MVSRDHKCHSNNLFTWIINKKDLLLKIYFCYYLPTSFISENKPFLSFSQFTIPNTIHVKSTFLFTSEHKDLFGVEGKEDDVINIHKIKNNVHDIKDDDVINIQNLAHNVRGISQTSLNDTSSTSHDSKNQVNNSRYVIDVNTEEF